MIGNIGCSGYSMAGMAVLHVLTPSRSPLMDKIDLGFKIIPNCPSPLLSCVRIRRLSAMYLSGVSDLSGSP